MMTQRMSNMCDKDMVICNGSFIQWIAVFHSYVRVDEYSLKRSTNLNTVNWCHGNLSWYILKKQYMGKEQVRLCPKVWEYVIQRQQGRLLFDSGGLRYAYERSWDMTSRLLDPFDSFYLFVWLIPLLFVCGYEQISFTRLTIFLIFINKVFTLTVIFIHCFSTQFSNISLLVYVHFFYI